MKVAITGATSGIGLRAARLFARAGHEVVALCRDLERAGAVLGGEARVDIEPLDLASPDSIRLAAARIGGAGPLGALVHNAAIFDQSQRLAQFTSDGHELVWATNHLGPFELTARLSGALLESEQPRVVFVASKGIVTMPGIKIRFGQLDQASWYSPVRAYYHSKLAQVMTALHLADLAGPRISVSCLRVPAVQLDVAKLRKQSALLRFLYAPKNALAMKPEAMACKYVDIVEAGASVKAVYINEHLEPVSLPRFARSKKNREQLWQTTQDIVGDPKWAW